jgi:ppGpp synthetase/RelA/SpoT-type nucleotidyltranferase
MKKKASKPSVEDFTREFSKWEPNYKALRQEAFHTIEKRLKKSGIKIHSIPSRVKDLDSFLGKIKRKQYENPFKQMQDFVGLRIICLFLSDISKIGKIIRESFEVIESEDKIDGGDTSSFGYMSVHHIVQFGDHVKGDRYDDIKGIPFEIQVRTIAMDSWANVSHYLEYKSEQDIPDELKRDFNALSGMFYVADKHFQLFFEQRLKKQEEIAEIFEKGNKGDISIQPINLDTITVYLREKFPDREHGNIKTVSQLVIDLILAGYKTIGEVDKSVNNGWDAFLDSERFSNIVDESKSTVERFADTGAMFVILSIVDDNFLRVAIKNGTSDSTEQEKLFKEYKEDNKPHEHLIKR